MIKEIALTILEEEILAAFVLDTPDAYISGSTCSCMTAYTSNLFAYAGISPDIGRGVLSSLIKKGLVYVGDDEDASPTEAGLVEIMKMLG